MKDDYSSVFRNLRTDRTTGRYAPIPEAKWLFYLGGAALGIAGAIVLYLWATI